MYWNSIYSQENRIYLDYDIQMMCNINCTYCFQKFDNSLNIKNDNKILLKNSTILLNLLKKHPFDFTLGLLGGEPTLNKELYFNILDKFSDIDKPNSDIFISTNFFQSYEFYKNHPNYNNVNHWLSLHPEYLNNINHKKNLFDKLELIVSKKFNIIISPMLYLTEKTEYFFKNIILELYYFCISNNIIYSPQIIFKNEEFKSNNFLDFLNKISYLKLPEKVFNQNIPEFFYNNKKITLNEVMKDNISYKNKTCSYNYGHIDENLTFTADCLNYNFNIKQNPVKFLKYFGKKIICQRDSCLDYPLLLTKKD